SAQRIPARTWHARRGGAPPRTEALHIPRPRLHGASRLKINGETGVLARRRGVVSPSQADPIPPIRSILISTHCRFQDASRCRPLENCDLSLILLTKLPVRCLSYAAAIARMFALGHELAQTPSHKFDLAHMRVLLEALEHPEKKFPAVLIAGTNGKGSTAATLASILQSSGYKTGLYTSPHLVRINVRIRIHGETITEIAREKVGILRVNVPVVTLPQTPEANDVIGNAILSLDAKAVTAVPYVPPVSPNSAQCLVPSTHEKAGYISRYPLQVL